MQLKQLSALIVCAAALLTAGPARAQTVLEPETTLVGDWPTQTAQVGEIAPLFHLIDLNSRELTYLSSYRGRRVVLYFTASWAQSATQLVRLARFHREHAAGGHEVLGISVDTVPRARLAPLLQTIGAEDLPFVIDPLLSAAWSYGIRSVPAVLFLDEHGRIVLREEAVGDLRFLELLKTIADQVERPLEEDPGTGEGLLARKQQVRALEKRIMRDAQNIDLRDEIAIAYYDAGFHDKALNQLDVADALEPNRLRAIRFWRRGVIHDAQGEPERALGYWRASAMALKDVPLIADNLLAIREPGLVYGYIPSATEVR